MLTLLFALIVLYVSGKIAGLALRAGWGIVKFLFGVILLPFTILGFLISGIIQFAVPILIIIGIITLVRYLFGSKS